MPNSNGSGTRVRQTVASAPVELWCLTSAVRSMSVRASPEMTTNVSSDSAAAAFFTLPAVPSGFSSVAYVRSIPRSSPSPKYARTIEPRKWTVTTVSVNWCRFKSRSTCSMIGRLTTGSRGLGMLVVMGRRRVPSPPAMTTAFTSPPPLQLPAHPASRLVATHPRGCPAWPPLRCGAGPAAPARVDLPCRMSWWAWNP